MHIVESKIEEEKLRKLCQDYELYSTNLDGSILEILQKVQEILDKDVKFLRDECERHGRESQALARLLDEVEKNLEKQALDGY